MHLVAAMYWTGSIMFLAIVATPVIARIRPPSFQKTLARRLWQIAHLGMWAAVVVLLVTGAWLGRRSGLISSEALSIGFWLKPMGMKLLLVGAAVALSLAHDMLLGYGARLVDPKESTEPPGFWGMVIPGIIAACAVGIAALSYSLRGT
jgi:hypothetical protein